jgi:ABC-type sugar transport system substrate-binding protein
MKTLKFVVSLPNNNSYQKEQAAAATNAARQLGAEVQILYADNDSIMQSQQLLEIIQSHKESKPDAILFEPLTSTALQRVGEAAVNAGIGWIVLNCDVDYLERLRKISNVPAFAITRDHTEIGRIQGRQFAALLPQGGNVLYIQGPATSSAAIQRTTGLESAKPSNIQVKALRSQWSEESANQTVSSWLRLSTSTAGSIDLVGCQYDGIAMGALKAFQNHIDSAERQKWLHIPFTGVDGLREEGQAWVDRGMLAATILTPTTTQLGMQMVIDALKKGIQPPERTLMELKSYPSLDQLATRGKQMAAQKTKKSL